MLQSQIVQQTKEIGQLKEQIENLHQYHNDVQQPDSNDVNDVPQVSNYIQFWAEKFCLLVNIWGTLFTINIQ